MKKRLKLILCFLLSLSLTACGTLPRGDKGSKPSESASSLESSSKAENESEEKYMNKKFDRKRLNIGVYVLMKYARTEQHIKDLADAGVDFVVDMEYHDRDALDLFEKYGVGAIVQGATPRWWGGNGKTGMAHELDPIERYERYHEWFNDHPAIWGISVVDEPSALDFEHFSEALDKVDELYENQFAYANLYPNYATVAENTEDEAKSQLGTATYAEYIEQYCKTFKQDYLSFDFYPYATNVAKYYDNFKIAADACRKYNKSLWIVLQVNSNNPEVWTSLNNLRFQAFSSMAFGVENITWACYAGGWWHNQVIDENGEKTQQYDKLKQVNKEIRALADDYMKYKNVSTHFVGYGENHPALDEVDAESVEALDAGDFKSLRATDEWQLVVGNMTARDGSGKSAVMVFAADNFFGTTDREYEVTFELEKGKTPRAICSGGEREIKKLSDNSYSIKIKSNEGIFIEAD